MAKYHPVSPNLWDAQFRSLDADAQRLYLYILTSPHRRSEGLFWLPVPYMAIDTGMDGDRVACALQELQKAGWVMYDIDAEMILDRRAMAFFPPTGSSQMAGALRMLKSLPKTHLKLEFAKQAFIVAPEFYTVIIEGITHNRGREEGCPELTVEEQTLDTLSSGLSRARARQLRDGDRDTGLSLSSSRPAFGGAT